MSTVAESTRTVEFDAALLTATKRAKLAHPTQACRIEKGLALVFDDAATDMQMVKPRWFTVRSAADPTTLYDVFSNGETVCSCPDYQAHGMAGNQYVCKHGWAVLLVRAARREVRSPRLRHAYHMASGEEGHCRHLSDGRVAFYPGGHKYNFVCMREEVCIGPYVNATGRPY